MGFPPFVGYANHSSGKLAFRLTQNKTSGDALIGMGGTLTLLVGKLSASKLEAAGLARALGLLALVPLARGAGSSLGSSLDAKRSEAALAPLKAREAANQEGLDKLKTALASARDASNKAGQEQLQDALKLTQNLNKEYLKRAAAAEAAQKKIDQLSTHRRLTPAEQGTLGNARRTVGQFNATRLPGNLPTKALGDLTNRAIKTPDDLSKALIDATKRAEELRAALDAAFQLGPQEKALKNEIDQTFQSLAEKATSRNSFGGEFSDNLRAQFSEVSQTLRKLRADTDLTDKEIGDVIEKRNKLGQSALAGQNPIVGKLGFASSLEQIDQVIAKLQALQKLQQAPSVAPQQSELDNIESVVGQFGTAANSSRAIAESWAETAASVEQAAAASQTIMNPYVSGPAEESMGGQIGGYADGGLVKSMKYFDKGGFAPRGTDTVPAMLSPGEFVVNAKSSRKFYSELVAMNSGQTPIHRAEGGAVTNNNVSIGDVVVQGGGNRDTGRAIAQQLRRELRRGTSIL